MYHQQWLEIVENALNEIETNYPNSPVNERNKWRNRIQQIKKSCDLLLESWSVIEERIANLFEEHPELSGNGKELNEEFWLNESVVRQFRQGQGYFGLTMFQEAKDLFYQVVDEEPEFLLGRIYLGLTQFHENQLEESTSNFRLIIQTASQEVFQAFAYHMLGCIEVKRGDDQQAIYYFRKAVGLYPEYSDGWFNLGACQYRLKEYYEAIPYFYHALNINENDWESMYYLSDCYRHYQEWGSVNFWRLACYEKTNHPQVISSIAQDYEEMGEFQKALEWYRRLLAYDQYKPLAFQGISWNYWALQDETNAFLWLKKGLTLYPKHPELLFTYVWICFSKGDYDLVEQVFSYIPKELSQQPVWLALRSRLSMQTGDMTQAIQIAEELIGQDVVSAQALGHYQKGRAYLEDGQIKKALTHFQEANTRMKNWKDPIFYQGVCHMMEGRPDLTRQCWDKIST